MACDVRQDETAMDQFALAESEWESVKEVTAQFQEDSIAAQVSTSPPITPLVTVAEVVEYLKSHGDLEHYLGQVKTGSRRSGLRKVFSCLLGPPALPPHLRQSARLVQATALISFSNEVCSLSHLQSCRSCY